MTYIVYTEEPVLNAETECTRLCLTSLFTCGLTTIAWSTIPPDPAAFSGSAPSFQSGNPRRIENADEKRILNHFDSSGFNPSILLAG
jgi:hypothetical protein